MSKKKRRVKLVAVRYGLLGNPNHAQIQRVIERWVNRGYTLRERDELLGGCFGMGNRTELTFIEDE